MTDEEILKKSIKKANKNGWKYEHDGRITNSLIDWIDNNDERYEKLMESISLESIIFDHDFAKAFFGIEETDFHDCPYCEYPGWYHVPNWQYHLQQMVLEEDPIKYLEKFL